MQRINEMNITERIDKAIIILLYDFVFCFLIKYKGIIKFNKKVF